MAIGIRFSVVLCAVFCLGITSAIDEQRLTELGTQCGTQAMQGISDFSSLATQEGLCDFVENVLKCILREAGPDQITSEQLQQVEATVNQRINSMQNNDFQCDIDFDDLKNGVATTTGEGDSGSSTVNQQKIMQVGQQCVMRAISGGGIDPTSMTNEAKCDLFEKVIKCILKQVGSGVTQEQLEQFESTMSQGQDPSGMQCDWTLRELMEEVAGNTGGDSGGITIVEFQQAGHACSQKVYGVSDPGNLTHEQRCDGLEDVINCLIGKVGANNINDMMIMALKKGFSSPDGAQCDVDVRNVIQQAKGSDSSEERCEKGYYRKDGECVDVNECRRTRRMRTPKCTGQYEECYNTPGSFQCHCEENYLRDDDGKCAYQDLVIQQCNPDNIMPGGGNVDCSALKKMYECVLPRFDNENHMDRWAATGDAALSARGTECDFTASEMAKQIQNDRSAAVRATPAVVMLGSVVVAVFLALC